MGSTNGNGTPLRFAALVRVSTEKQEQQGESLRTQRSQNEKNAALLGGPVVAWYGGQEHATEGWERKELARLAADAASGKFDAVILAHADRWDRGGKEAGQVRETLKEHGIRFFIGVSEYDLRNPEHVLFLDLSSAIGKFQASNQNKKSILSRIARARRGLPTAGRALPFGRTWDKKAEQWGLDPDKKALVEDVAARYLAGESLVRLAKEYRIDHSYLCDVLRDRCGERWELEFNAPELNIRETIAIRVPRLLEEKTIKAIHERLKANRTYLKKPPRSVHNYLLGGRIFCEACGCLMTGQVATNSGGKVFRYYRHAHNERGLKCPVLPRPWVRADRIEEEVVRQLFGMFGNPQAIIRAVEAAAPNLDRERKRQVKLEAGRQQVEKARARILALVAKDAITDQQAEKQLKELKDREAGLREELNRLADMLASVPDAEAVGRSVRVLLFRGPVEWVDEKGNKRVAHFPQTGGPIIVHDGQGNALEGDNFPSSFDRMALPDKRRLVESVFSTPLPDGKPAGVYVAPAEGGKRGCARHWTFAIRGRVDFESVISSARRWPSPCRS